MKFYSVFLYLFLCLNFSALIINQIVDWPASETFDKSPTDVLSIFNLNILIISLSGATVIGLISIFTRQYMFGSVILVVWIVGVLVPIVQEFIAGVPILLLKILPAELSVIPYMVAAFVAFNCFMFFSEVFMQRQAN